MRSVLFIALQLLALTLFAANSYADDLKLLVSVKDLQNDSKVLTQQICDRFKTGDSPYPFSVTCTNVSAFDLSDDKVHDLLSKDSYDFHIQIMNLSQVDKLEIVTHNLKPYDMFDFVKVSNFYFGDADEKIESAVNHVLQVTRYHNHHLDFRRYMISRMAPFSKLVRIEKDGRIKDPKTGLSFTWEQAFGILTYESAEHEKVARALIELSAVLGFASYKYYQNLVVNRKDFDYDKFSDKIRDTVFSTKGWSYDTNKELYNSGHALAGQAYYQIARSNGFSAFKSFAITTVASWYWEVIGERKEKASINDMVVTSVGGSILGEAGFQISRAIRKKSNSILAHTLAFFFDPASAINRLINRLTGHRDAFLSDLTQEQYAEMETYIARSVGDEKSTTVGIHADIVNLANYRDGKDGDAQGVITDIAAAEVVAEYTKNKLSKAEMKLITTVAWMGYHKKRVHNQIGYEALATVSSEFEYDKRAYPVEDFNLTVHALGPQLRVDGYINGFRISATVGVYADFAMINSLALAAYDKANPNQRQGLQSIIKEEGYYYGLGTTEKIRLALSKDNWTVFYEGQNSRVKSINNRDRFPELATKNEKYSDTKILSGYGLNFRLTKNISVTAKREKIFRKSMMDNEYSNGYTVRRSAIQLNYQW